MLNTYAQVEGELTWLTYIIGTILGSHHPGSSCSESHQMIDAQVILGEFSDLIVFIIQLCDDRRADDPMKLALIHN